MSTCDKCSKHLPKTGDYVTCFGGCNARLHFGCSGLSGNAWRQKSNKLKQEWRCQTCHLTSAGKNDTTPFVVIPHSPATNPRKRKRVDFDESPVASEPLPRVQSSEGTELRELLTFLQEKFDNIQREMGDIRTTIQLLSEKYELSPQVETSFLSPKVTTLISQIREKEIHFPISPTRNTPSCITPPRIIPTRNNERTQYEYGSSSNIDLIGMANSPSRGLGRLSKTAHKLCVGSMDDQAASRCLRVYGLSLYTQERYLRELFSKYGNVEEVQIVYDAQTGRSQGYAFVYFENTDEAELAKECCTGIEVDGRKILVDFSIKPLKQPTFAVAI